jgi:hypothetical protein
MFSADRGTFPRYTVVSESFESEPAIATDTSALRQMGSSLLQLLCGTINSSMRFPRERISEAGLPPRFPQMEQQS